MNTAHVAGAVGRHSHSARGRIGAMLKCAISYSLEPATFRSQLHQGMLAPNTSN